MPSRKTDGRRTRRGDDAEYLSERLSSSLGRTSPRSPAEALQPEPVPPPPPRSRAVRHPLVVFFNFVLTVTIVAVVAVGGSTFLAKMQFEGAGEFDQASAITIERGTGLGAIADRLLQDGLIASKWLFVAGVWLNNQQGNLKAGEYLIPASASMRDIMDTMTTGRGILYAVTVPEGLTSKQVVDLLRADPVLVGEVAEIPREGSLLPETYKFTRGDTRQDVIDRMRTARDLALEEVWATRAPDLPVATPDELAVLASVVEKETSLADERSRVAAVFNNRLRSDMRLQSDPTVVFGIFAGDGPPRGFVLSRADLETGSPYNTYLIDGLPPGPIANPGRAALEAVANPSRTSDLYFVADGTGGHAFAETFEEHQRNVARWRKINGALAPPADQAAASDASADQAAEEPATDTDTAAAADPALDPNAPMQLQPKLRPPQ